MDSNRYAPPLAAIAGPSADAAPTFLDPARKPVSAWLLQILCAGFIALLLWMEAKSLMVFQGRSGHLVWWRLLSGLVFNVPMLAWFGFALVGIQRRARHGRVLGLGVLGLLLLAAIWTFLRTFTLIDHGGADMAYHAGEVLGGAFWLLVLGWWVRAFGFSKKARIWFRLAPAAQDRADRWEL